MTTNIWPIQPSLPKQVDTIYIGEGIYDQEFVSNVYPMPMLSLQKKHKKTAVTHTVQEILRPFDFLVHPFQEDNRQAGAAFLKQVITEQWMIYKVMRLMMLMDPPYKISQIGGDVIGVTS